MKLPSSGGDTGGISNLKIAKIIGRSNDGSGLPASYSNQETIIDPADNDVAWDPIQQVWSVNFQVTGFGAFYIKASSVTLSSDSGSLFKDQTILYPTIIEKNGQINIDFPYEKGIFNLYSTEGKIVDQLQLKKGLVRFTPVLKQVVFIFTVSIMRQDI